MCGGRGQQAAAAAAAAGGGLQSCARIVSAGQPECSKKGLVVKLRPLVALVIQNMHVYICNPQHSALQRLGCFRHETLVGEPNPWLPLMHVWLLKWKKIPWQSSRGRKWASCLSALTDGRLLSCRPVLPLVHLLLISKASIFNTQSHVPLSPSLQEHLTATVTRQLRFGHKQANHRNNTNSLHSVSVKPMHTFTGDKI